MAKKVCDGKSKIRSKGKGKGQGHGKGKGPVGVPKKQKNMIKLPDKIKIGGHEYKVEYPYKFEERYDIYGQWNDPKKIIYVSDVDGNGVKRADSSIIVTFIHEILHAIDGMAGLDIFAKHEKDGREPAEVVSEIIYQILVDNPEMFKAFK